MADSANYSTPPTNIKVFKQQFNHLRQPTYDSDSEDDIFGTPESQNLSCSSYTEYSDKELNHIIEINKAEDKDRNY